MSLEEELSRLSTYSEELGLNLLRPDDRLKWFLASILFAKRISTEIARKTYRRFEAEGLTTPDKILAVGWDRLVQVLDAGGYVRYDFSTATNLLKIMEDLERKYGDLEVLHAESFNPRDLERRLEEFRGVGPVGVNIFLRELRGIWKNAEPKPSVIAIKTARKLSLDQIEPYESALVRINLEFCKRQRCKKCPVKKHCGERVNTQ